MKLSTLISDSAKKATEKGHKIGHYRVTGDGAMARCTKCNRHVHIAVKGNVIFGSATYRPCE